MGGVYGTNDSTRDETCMSIHRNEHNLFCIHGGIKKILEQHWEHVGCVAICIIVEGGGGGLGGYHG